MKLVFAIAALGESKFLRQRMGYMEDCKFVDLIDTSNTDIDPIDKKKVPGKTRENKPGYYSGGVLYSPFLGRFGFGKEFQCECTEAPDDTRGSVMTAYPVKDVAKANCHCNEACPTDGVPTGTLRCCWGNFNKKNHLPELPELKDDEEVDWTKLSKPYKGPATKMSEATIRAKVAALREKRLQVEAEAKRRAEPDFDFEADFFG